MVYEFSRGESGYYNMVRDVTHVHIEGTVVS